MGEQLNPSQGNGGRCGQAQGCGPWVQRIKKIGGASCLELHGGKQARV